MGSEESHFNVSVGSDGQSHRALSTNHSLFEEKGEPKRYRTEGPSAYQPNALPLGQTDSLKKKYLQIWALERCVAPPISAWIILSPTYQKDQSEPQLCLGKGLN